MLPGPEGVPGSGAAPRRPSPMFVRPVAARCARLRRSPKFGCSRCRQGRRRRAQRSLDGIGYAPTRDRRRACPFSRLGVSSQQKQRALESLPVHASDTSRFTPRIRLGSRLGYVSVHASDASWFTPRMRLGTRLGCVLVHASDASWFTPRIRLGSRLGCVLVYVLGCVLVYVLGCVLVYVLGCVLVYVLVRALVSSVIPSAVSSVLGR